MYYNRPQARQVFPMGSHMNDAQEMGFNQGINNLFNNPQNFFNNLISGAMFAMNVIANPDIEFFQFQIQNGQREIQLSKLTAILIALWISCPGKIDGIVNLSYSNVLNEHYVIQNINGPIVMMNPGINPLELDNSPFIRVCKRLHSIIRVQGYKHIAIEMGYLTGHILLSKLILSQIDGNPGLMLQLEEILWIFSTLICLHGYIRCNPFSLLWSSSM